ncbi:hypothetical protein A3B05_02305 [Candidatus Giovannonibacteria bacterium RIFCSPLOWO2_01_FULL_43_160]|uniref:Uncharacterized protein n=2 Tax=Candidatus Giovannoniibacteriota TaxID=1752738 RepID=A0A0G1IX26_9BACT|nr:MAG: hypothetical protein UV72_C0002G0052 [Candidatus Giovannonibacteria bacterium GW2011_GWB1_43_13]KKS99842.1 MAG: hypothetical protein UV75_C0001G0007 [Candidatus Giovannonibacteria bacterium GW2011_GWA1_43_15]KKT20532.1 MAG: hypothetical protein UW05_C0035G0008 [Candidatus Giovannonibacteria bacterium GW2011_GWC2_43_8]KKT63543.1 MAG: hypothetical protein UW55_C0002G0008 [Candidatus Giovannonibacteria bacterium GW2011_GWA2_44_26]OGF58582.1 MAG: hypothetical protein A2652_02255 [Candidatus
MTTKPRNGKNFRRLIIDTIKKDEDAIPGRAGETPISDLACMFKKLKDKEADEAIKTIVDLINTPPDPLLVADPKKFWFNVMFLSHYPKGEKNSLRDAFFARLFGERALDRSLLIWMFNGYIEAGGIFDQPMLLALSFLRDESPIAWLNAAARSREFDFVKNEAVQLLRDGKISSRTGSVFIYFLDFLKKLWPSEEDFFKVVEEFHDAAQDQDTKEKLQGWIDRHKK